MKMLRSVWYLSMFFAVGFLSTTAHASLASTLLDKELRAVLQSRSAADLDAAIVDHDEIRKLREECEVQLDRQRLPTLCFRVLAREERAGLIASSKVKVQEEWLGQLCVRRLKLSRDRTEIRKLLEVPKLPRICRVAAGERDADLRYTQESDHPSRVFKERASEPSARTLHDVPSS